jgi:hypothetical protein
MDARSKSESRSWWPRGWFHYSVSEHCLIRGTKKPQQDNDPTILELRSEQESEKFSKYDLLNWVGVTGGEKTSYFNDARLAFLISVAVICFIGGAWAGYGLAQKMIQQFSPWLLFPLLLHLLWSVVVFTYYTVSLFSKKGGQRLIEMLGMRLSPFRPFVWLYQLIVRLYKRFTEWIKDWANKNPSHFAAKVWRGACSLPLFNSPGLRQVAWVHVKWPKNLYWLIVWGGALFALFCIPYDAPTDEEYRWNPDTPRHQDQLMNIIQIALPSARRIDKRVVRWANIKWRNTVMFDERAWKSSEIFQIGQGAHAPNLVYGIEDEVTISYVPGEPSPERVYFMLKPGELRSVSAPDFMLRTKASHLSHNPKVISVTHPPDSPVALEMHGRDGRLWLQRPQSTDGAFGLRDNKGKVRKVSSSQQEIEIPIETGRLEVLADAEAAPPITWIELSVKALPRITAITKPDTPNQEWRRFFRSLITFYGVVPRLIIFLPILGLYIKARRALWVELDAEEYVKIIEAVKRADPCPISVTKKTPSWPPREQPVAVKPPPPPLTDGRAMIAKYNLELGEKEARGKLPAPDHYCESAYYYGPIIGTSLKNKPFLEELKKVNASVVYLYANFDFTPDDDLKALAQRIVQKSACLHVVLLKRAIFVENRGSQAAGRREKMWREELPEATVEMI